MVTTRRGTRMITVGAVLAAGILGGQTQAAPGTAIVNTVSPNSIVIPTQEWVDVTDQPSGITVKLPGKATPADVPGGGRGYSVQTGDNAVSFIVIDGSLMQSDLDSFLQNFAKGIGGTLTSSQKTTAKGHPAIDGRLTLTKEGTRVVDFVRGIATTTHFLVLSTVGLVGDETAVKQVHQRLLAGVRIP